VIRGRAGVSSSGNVNRHFAQLLSDIASRGMEKYEKGTTLGQGQFGHVFKAKVKAVRSREVFRGLGRPR
jgi:hypothetical protein